MAIQHYTEQNIQLIFDYFTLLGSLVFQSKGKQKRKKKKPEVAFSVLNYNPLIPPNQKVEGAITFRNARKMNTTGRQEAIFTLFSANQLTNLPTLQLRITSQFRKNQPPLQCAYFLSQCCYLLRSVVCSLSVFSAAVLLLFKVCSSVNHITPSFARVFLLS